MIIDRLLHGHQRSVFVRVMFYDIDLESAGLHVLPKKYTFIEVKWSVVEGKCCMLMVAEHV